MIPLGGDSTTIQEALQVLQPTTSWTEISGSSGLSPESAANAVHPEVPPQLDFVSEPNNPFVFDVASNWLSPMEGVLFCHGGGLELDDIFTALTRVLY